MRYNLSVLLLREKIVNKMNRFFPRKLQKLLFDDPLEGVHIFFLIILETKGL